MVLGIDVLFGMWWDNLVEGAVYAVAGVVTSMVRLIRKLSRRLRHAAA